MVLLAFALGLCSRGAVHVSKETYRIWPNSYRISNGLIDVVVVPQIGRIMRLGRANGPNLLFESPLKADGKAEFGGLWQNFGGDKIWPAPQSVWKWPPEPQYDVQPWRVEPTKDGLRMWTTQPGSITGLLLERSIHLATSQTEIVVENRYTNASQTTQRFAGWQICQVADPAMCILPRDLTDSGGKGWSTYEPIDVSDITQQVGSVIQIHRDRKRSAKFGSTSSAGFVSAFFEDDVLVLSADHPKGEYVDGGKAQQVYISQDPAKYAEIEITGPLTSVPPGGSLVFKTKLQLSRQLPR